MLPGELEEVSKNSKPPQKGNDLPELFWNLTTRTEEDRYFVNLPLKEFPPFLYESKDNSEILRAG